VSVDYSAEALRVAEAFVSARRDGRALPDYPGRIPDTLDRAYSVQDAAIGLRDAPIGGWKVGRINPPQQGYDRLAGPIFVDRIVRADHRPPVMSIFRGGFGAAESEFLLRVGTAPDPGQKHFTHDQAAALIDAIHIGIEVASSPFPRINQLGPTVTISDFGNNNGLVVGQPIDGWRDQDYEHWPVELRINGEVAGSGKATDMLDGPIGAARFLFELLATRGILLQPGQWISSGAVTGVHPVVAGDRVEARFDGRLSVQCTIEAS
jgi:2-keto-4-pentenoate hydratase